MPLIIRFLALLLCANIAFAQSFQGGTGGGSSTAVATQCEWAMSQNSAIGGDWIPLDGRLKSSLTPAQQVVATACGYGTNLPDMRGKMPLGVSGSFANNTTGGALTIAQNQLPNVAPTASANMVVVNNGGSQISGGSTSGVSGIPGWVNAGGTLAGYPNAPTVTVGSINGNVTQQNFLPPYATAIYHVYLGPASPSVTVTQALSLTTTGSGAATFNAGTGALNIPDQSRPDWHHGTSFNQAIALVNAAQKVALKAAEK